MPRQFRRTILTTAITATAAATALAGCGSSSNAGRTASGGGTSSAPSGTASASESPAPTAPTTREPDRPSGAAPSSAGTDPGRPRCTAGMLDVSLTDLDPAAGNRYATLVITNKSGKHCTTGGWSGLQLANANGAVPTKTVREGTARTVTIRNGGHAYERLHWSAVPAGDETGADCEPVPSTLRVIPPNETTRTSATWKYGPACQHGQIRLTPISTQPEPAYR